MISLPKLATLRGRTLTRKCAVLLEGLQRSLCSASDVPGNGGGIRIEGDQAADYARGIAKILADSPAAAADPGLRAAALRLAACRPDMSPNGGESAYASADSSEGYLRALDALRHACIRASGQSSADWDLLPPRAAGPGSPSVTAATPDSGLRAPGGLRAYLEDIRSPFNVGTIFRTADAFGFSEILLSPDCADPRHPRALRSSMGAVDLVPWRRAALDELAACGPCFALELGGADLGAFRFPVRGTVILGSEELGVSAQALELCELGKVSIPMRGAKASMNVAVAFGVLSWAWSAGVAATPSDPAGINPAGII